MAQNAAISDSNQSIQERLIFAYKNADNRDPCRIRLTRSSTLKDFEDAVQQQFKLSDSGWYVRFEDQYGSSRLSSDADVRGLVHQQQVTVYYEQESAATLGHTSPVGPQVLATAVSQQNKADNQFTKAKTAPKARKKVDTVAKGNSTAQGMYFCKL